MISEFRLYADPWRKHYCLVRLFDTGPQMRADIRRLTKQHIPRDVVGQVRGGESRDVPGAFGVMWLCIDQLRIHSNEFTSHECAHAAMRYVESRGWSVSANGPMFDEERYCYALGRMQKRLIAKLYKLGVFK